MKSIRLQVLVGTTEQPDFALHFDLAGAHAVTYFTNEDEFVDELGKRLLTAICTHEINDHDIQTEAIPAAVWQQLASADALVRVGEIFTNYGFFTDPISIFKLIGFRGFGEAVSAHYSEGCYATYEPLIEALLTTATGSARFIDKRALIREDIALVSGIKPDRSGAYVLPVEGKPTVVPSVEAVELFGICAATPPITIDLPSGSVEVPMVRSLLHGHVGVAAYDPRYVEHVMLDPEFAQYPVSCGTNILARITAEAFARSESLQNFADPRRIVFLEQPCHGVLVVEKWDPSLPPFEEIARALQNGWLQMTKQVPQSSFVWSANELGMHVKTVSRELPRA